MPLLSSSGLWHVVRELLIATFFQVFIQQAYFPFNVPPCSAVAGGVLGGATALFGNRPPLPTMLSVGANSTMVSFAFFGQLLCSLDDALHSCAPNAVPSAPELIRTSSISFGRAGIRELAVQPTLKDFGWQREGADQFRPHTEGLTATALAGALTGGAFMGRLRRSCPQLCSALHYALIHGC